MRRNSRGLEEKFQKFQRWSEGILRMGDAYIQAVKVQVCGLKMATSCLRRQPMPCWSWQSPKCQEKEFMQPPTTPMAGTSAAFCR